MRHFETLLRSVIALSALSLFGPTAGCSGDDSGADQSDAGADGRKDVATSNRTVSSDVSTAPIMCTNSPSACGPLSIAGAITLPACCSTDNDKCGNDLSGLTSLAGMLPGGAAMDVAAPMLDGGSTCVEKNQPGVADPTCPSAALGPVALVGCCTPAGHCGALINDFSLMGISLSFGFGCVNPAQFGLAPADGSAPATCTYTAEGGTRDGGDGGMSTEAGEAGEEAASEAAVEAGGDGAQTTDANGSDAASTSDGSDGS